MSLDAIVASLDLSDAIAIHRENKLVVRYTTGCRTYLCGYAEFPRSEIPERWWDNYTAEGLKYLRVHGGITFGDTDDTTVVFGLDCAHAGDGDRPELQDPEYVFGLVEDMEALIMLYAARNDEWRAASPGDRMAILDEVNAVARVHEGFGVAAMLDMLCSGTTFAQIDPFARVRAGVLVPSTRLQRLRRWLKKWF